MTTKLLRLLAVVLALTLIAAACGDDAADDTATDDADPADDDADATDDTATDDADPADAADDDADSADDADAMVDEEMMVPDDWPESIVFGFVPSQEQETLQDDIQPFITVLEEGLGIEVEGIVTPDYTGLVTAMGTDQADLGAFGPFGYTLGADQFGNMEALIQSIRFGSATYHGQWFTNDPTVCDAPPVEASSLENSPDGVVQVDSVDAVALQVGVFFGDDGPTLGETVENADGERPPDGDPISPGSSCMADLSVVAGRTVAFTSESSTSGYLFPALELTNLDIDPASDVTPTFSGSHDAAVTAVYNGDADFGLSFDDARRTIRDENPDVGEKVIVFSITREIPNDVVAIRSELPETLKDAVYDTVEAYLATEEGEAIFDEIYGWTDVRPAEEGDFDIVREAATALGITEPPE